MKHTLIERKFIPVRIWYRAQAEKRDQGGRRTAEEEGSSREARRKKHVSDSGLSRLMPLPPVTGLLHVISRLHCSPSASILPQRGYLLRRFHTPVNVQ